MRVFAIMDLDVTCLDHTIILLYYYHQWNELGGGNGYSGSHDVSKSFRSLYTMEKMGLLFARGSWQDWGCYKLGSCIYTRLNE